MVSLRIEGAVHQRDTGQPVPGCLLTFVEGRIGISPGNRTDRGRSTVQAILGYCGKPLPGGAIGWRGTRSWRYPAPVGRRLLSACDVPDLVLLGPRFAGERVCLVHAFANGCQYLGRVRD